MTKAVLKYGERFIKGALKIGCSVWFWKDILSLKRLLLVGILKRNMLKSVVIIQRVFKKEVKIKSLVY